VKKEEREEGKEQWGWSSN